jgi:hypothetical protein
VKLVVHITVYIEDPKEALSVDYIHMEDTKVKETTIADIVTTTYFVGSNTTFVISLDAS